MSQKKYAMQEEDGHRKKQESMMNNAEDPARGLCLFHFVCMDPANIMVSDGVSSMKIVFRNDSTRDVNFSYNPHGDAKK